MMGLPLRLARDIRDAVARPVALVLALLLVGGTASLVAFFPKEGTAATPAAATAASAAPVSGDARAQVESAWAQQPRVDLGVPADGASVIVVKFNDYMCPMCRIKEAEYKPVLDRFAKSDPGSAPLTDMMFTVADGREPVSLGCT